MGETTSPFYDLSGFARYFLTTHSIRGHKDIRTERLADAIRWVFRLGPFPDLGDLTAICRHWNIPIQPLPPGPSGLLGANTWYDQGPVIFLRENLSPSLAASTLAHELREVLENAFMRAQLWYQGLRTSDNTTMNSESDQFAAFLLMQADATDRRLRELGFDFLQFSKERERSLPSVVLRAQELYSSKSTRSAPYAGVWVFEAPWNLVEVGTVGSRDLEVRYCARLSGFSQAKGRSQASWTARTSLPIPGSPLHSCRTAWDAVDRGRPVVDRLRGFDLLGERDYMLAAEPVFVGKTTPWRVFTTAVRLDCVGMVEPWLARLSSD